MAKWATHAWDCDNWNVACIFFPPGQGNCPNPAGPDYDFGGAGPNMISLQGSDAIGIGQKSGLHWAFNPDTGSVLWKTQVGPGSGLGGIEWGTAFDGRYIYAPIANLFGIPYNLQPSNSLANGGSWAALNPTTGAIVWQTANPGTCAGLTGSSQGCMALGRASAANGVVFVGSMDTDASKPTMFALDASTGQILWSYVAGSSVNAAPAIDGTTLYWGSGYRKLGSLGAPNNKLFAFSVNGK